MGASTSRNLPVPTCNVITRNSRLSVPTDMICTYWHDLYLLTWSVPTGVICTYWRDPYLPTWSVPTDMICTYRHDLYLLTWSVSTDMICTYWHDLYLLTWSVPTDMICAYWHDLCLLTWSVPTDMICTYWHDLCLPTWSVPTDMICTYWHDLYLLTCLEIYNFSLRKVTFVPGHRSGPNGTRASTIYYCRTTVSFHLRHGLSNALDITCTASMYGQSVGTLPTPFVYRFQRQCIVMCVQFWIWRSADRAAAW
jgi:hypothetical protein